ncbi:MAG: SLC13 family permease [Thaumarchaeota archaeon]|nr:SLC13 family permease [Nitrososphaerota archaeon]MCL5317341.1 SLC13 family permease [Nitrososphaerota archaeon]
MLQVSGSPDLFALMLQPAFIVFFAVYALIVLRNLGRVNLPVWTVMFAGAVAMLFLNGISLKTAYAAINLDVVFFLIGMFSIVSGMDASGLLRYITIRLLRFAGTPERVMLFILVALGTISAFLMNDTVAVVATPIVIGVAHEMKIRPTPLLVSLAFAVSIGSVMTPMGNPQNLLVALDSGMNSPVLEFLRLLGPPTLINFVLTYYLLKFYYKRDLSTADPPRDLKLDEAITDMRLAKTTGLVAALTIAGFFALSIIKVVGVNTDLNFGSIALLGSAVLYTASPRRRELIRGVNWSIIIFFMSMFIVMQAVWDAGLINLFASYMPPLNHGDSPAIIINIVGVSVFMSQLMSNVPFVAVYVNLMKSLGFGLLDTKAWLALAGGSTLAGNLTILGAASTIIILEAAEEKGHTFSFYEYFKIGSMVTLVNVTVLILWLTYA